MRFEATDFDDRWELTANDLDGAKAEIEAYVATLEDPQPGAASVPADPRIKIRPQGSDEVLATFNTETMRWE